MKLDHFFSWLEVHHGDTVDDPALLKEIFMEDEEFAGTVLQTVVQTVDQYKAVIDDDRIPTHDRNFYIAVHSLKSTVASIGMQTMAAVLQRLETRIRSGESITGEERQNLQVYTDTILSTVHQMNEQLNTR